jgi:cellulose synthase/poly-beta-1,6-N-acetylglucosamine synthase-like glycosyltransferase
MKVTIIISIYKDIEALLLILKSLANQTYKDFEILISEDGNSEIIKSFLKKYDYIIHCVQEDNGWRKNKALNNAIRQSSGEYLIFIDGDIIPYSDFIEQHIKFANPKNILIGKRMELGKYFSLMLRKKIISSTILEKLFIPFSLFIGLDKDARHLEDGLRLNIGNYLGDKIRRKNKMILGCNFSCYKNDIEKINGFDEDYIEPSVGEDYDLVWRFEHFNIKLKSVRNLANVFHLWHVRRWSDKINKINKDIMNKKLLNKEYICKNGLIKLK